MPAIHVQIVESAAGQIESWLQRREIDIGLPYRSHDALGSDEDVLLRLPSYLIGSARGPHHRRAPGAVR